jgi:hypothetical protein
MALVAGERCRRRAAAEDGRVRAPAPARECRRRVVSVLACVSVYRSLAVAKGEREDWKELPLEVRYADAVAEQASPGVAQAWGLRRALRPLLPLGAIAVGWLSTLRPPVSMMRSRSPLLQAIVQFRSEARLGLVGIELVELRMVELAARA